MVATSNSQLNLDLPKYISSGSNTGSGDARQGTQLLFNTVADPTSGAVDNTWRQARIDLSQFAGDTNVKIQFRVDENFANNNYKGFAIDDIVVASSGRGEMVTYEPPASGGTAAPISTDFFAVPQNPDPAAPTQILVGAYQLSIRRGQEYAFSVNGIDPTIAIYQQFDATSRLSQSFSMLTPGAFGIAMPDANAIINNSGSPYTFTLADGTNTVTFEFVAANADPTKNVTQTAGHVGILVVQDETTEQLAYSVMQAINNPTRASAIGQSSPAVKLNVVATLDPTGTLVYLDGATNIDTSATPGMATIPEIFDGDTFTVSDGFHTRVFEFNTTGGTASGNIAINVDPTDGPISMANKVAAAINGQFSSIFGVTARTAGAGEVNLFRALSMDQTGDTALQVLAFQNTGDTNPVRSQGEIIIANNTIRSAANNGIQVLPANRDSQFQAASNLAVLNNQRLVPGLVIANNVIDSAGAAGILFSGDPNSVNGVPQPSAVVSFGRIINNTIYGAGSGVGIQVSNNASPTLLNNILAKLQTGVSVDSTSSSTVLGANLFQGNTQDTVGTGLGSFAIQQAPSAPLFVNPANHNFNLVEKSSTGVVNKAIDSSLNTLQDRADMTTIDAPLGISASPIIAPANDQTGKLRIDDPSISPPLSGLGSNVFIDRGALDRSDFTGPLASLVNPVDNSSSDTDPTVNSVLTGLPLATFQIQISDGTGSGVDPSSVLAASFVITRDGVPLVLGTDYTFTFDSTNNVARFAQTTGIWASNHTYVITVDNSSASGIKDLAGNSLLPTNQSGTTKFTISLQQLNFGAAPAPYPTTLAQDGARHIISSNGLFFGTSESPSADGQPNSSAGNGNAGNGVVFGTLVPGTVGSAVVTASKSGGILNAWIDWNGNGSWA
ncbi:MAG: hypothetical protein ABUL64_01005, partial [Singulisphaera sp.]